MAKYKRQFFPGSTAPAKNRRRYLDPKVKLKQLRDVPMDDVVGLWDTGPLDPHTRASTLR